MAFGDFKDLKKRTATDKVLKYKAFNIAKSPKYDGYQRGLASIVCNFLIKRLKALVRHLQINLILNLYIKMKS